MSWPHAHTVTMRTVQVHLPASPVQRSPTIFVLAVGVNMLFLYKILRNSFVTTPEEGDILLPVAQVTLHRSTTVTIIKY